MENITLKNVRAAEDVVWTTEQATSQLRWSKNGKLQQLFRVISFGPAESCTEIWKDVPTET